MLEPIHELVLVQASLHLECLHLDGVGGLRQQLFLVVHGGGGGHGLEEVGVSDGRDFMGQAGAETAAPSFSSAFLSFSFSLFLFFAL